MPNTPEPGTTGASSSEGTGQQATPTTDPMMVGGRKVVYETDLIAAKRSLEGKLEQQQAVHVEAIDKAQLEKSEALQSVAQLNAKMQELEQARQSGVVSEEDITRLKQELEAAKNGQETASNALLELRRANIVLASGGNVTAEQLKDKNPIQLDAFEEAVKVVNSSRGSAGSYATGGGSGSATPETPMERARRTLDNTPIRGTRTATTT